MQSRTYPAGTHYEILKHTHTHTHSHIHTPPYTHTHTHTHSHTLIQTHTNTHTHTPSYTHKHPHTHTHTNTHTDHTLVSSVIQLVGYFASSTVKKKVKFTLVQTLRLCIGPTANRGVEV